MERPEDFLRKQFGDVIYEYPDSEAIADGILVPYLTPSGKDTHHRITTNAFNDLQAHYQPRYPEYKFEDFYKFFFAEMLPLIPFAIKRWDEGEILTTDYDFRVIKDQERPDRLWHLPNEVGGVTTMLPGDY